MVGREPSGPGQGPEFRKDAGAVVRHAEDKAEQVGTGGLKEVGAGPVPHPLSGEGVAQRIPETRSGLEPTAHCVAAPKVDVRAVDIRVDALDVGQAAPDALDLSDPGDAEAGRSEEVPELVPAGPGAVVEAIEDGNSLAGRDARRREGHARLEAGRGPPEGGSGRLRGRGGGRQREKRRQEPSQRLRWRTCGWPRPSRRWSPPRGRKT